MTFTSIILPILSLVVVFLFSIQKFSNHIHRAASERFKRALQSVTATPLKGLLAGTAFTALIQSSTATTVILAGLVNAGILSFAASVGVIFGANIGTTITSQLVALKVTSIAPYFVLVGFALTLLGARYREWGKSLFYFGLVFFSLSLISLYVEPVKSDPAIVALFSGISSFFVAFMVGLVFTAIVQSSSVTSGLAVLLVAQGLLTFDQAIGIVLGANLGTTSTALLASLGMHTGAKKVAVAHLLFNFFGILLFLPFIDEFTALVKTLGGTPERVLANAHLIFNVTAALIFLVLARPFTRLVNALFGHAA